MAVQSCLTERLRLEPIKREHADDLWRLQQDRGIAQWYAGPWSRAEAGRNAAMIGLAWETEGVHKWMAYDRISGVLVGRGGLSRAIIDGRNRLEIGWAVRERFWGRGYAAEIGRAGLGFAFVEGLAGVHDDARSHSTQSGVEASRAMRGSLGNGANLISFWPIRSLGQAEHLSIPVDQVCG